MTAILVPALLAVATAAAWLACLGCLRLPDPLDRLHCASLVNVVALPCTVAAAFIADGPSNRAWSFLFAGLVALIVGAAASHASARAITQRRDAMR